MNKDTIKDALLSAFALLSDELESVVIDELKEEYIIVLDKIEKALATLPEEEGEEE